MSSPKLAPDGRSLLANQLDTSEKLELVHALRVAGRPLSTAELATACRLPPTAVRDVLGSLRRVAVIEAVDDGQRFRISATARASGVEALMAVYEDDRSIVLSALTELALERIRVMAAAAFVIKKRGND